MARREFTPSEETVENDGSTGVRLQMPSFSDIRESISFPVGESYARVKRATPGLSKKGIPQLMLIWELVDDNRKTIIHTLYFDENGFQYTMPVLVGLGIEDFSGGEFDHTELLGREAYINVKLDPAKNGYAEQMRVKRVSQAPMSASVDDLSDSVI